MGERRDGDEQDVDVSVRGKSVRDARRVLSSSAQRASLGSNSQHFPSLPVPGRDFTIFTYSIRPYDVPGLP